MKSLIILFSVLSLVACKSMPGISSNPDDYPDTFSQHSPSSYENQYKSDSIYGFKVGETLTSTKGLTKIARNYSKSNIYKVSNNKLIKDGPIKRKVKEIRIKTDIETNTIRAIVVEYDEHTDAQWIRGKIREYLIGDANAKYAWEEGFDQTTKVGKGYLARSSFVQLSTLKECRDKMGFALLCTTVEGSAHRRHNEIDYGFVMGKTSHLVVGNIPYHYSLKSQLDNITSRKIMLNGRFNKSERYVDDNGIVTNYLVQYSPNVPEYVLGLGLKGVVAKASYTQSKGKHTLDEFVINFKNEGKFGRAYSIGRSTPHLLIGTHVTLLKSYLSGRKYYSKELPKLLNAELGCSFPRELLPSEYDEKTLFTKEFKCSQKGREFILKVSEYDTNDADGFVLNKKSFYELGASLTVKL